MAIAMTECNHPEGWPDDPQICEYGAPYVSCDESPRFRMMNAEMQLDRLLCGEHRKRIIEVIDTIYPHPSKVGEHLRKDIRVL